MGMFTSLFFFLYLKNFCISFFKKYAQLHSTRRCTYMGFGWFCLFAFLLLLFRHIIDLFCGLSITSSVRKEFEFKTLHLISWKSLIKMNNCL